MTAAGDKQEFPPRLHDERVPDDSVVVSGWSREPDHPRTRPSDPHAIGREYVCRQARLRVPLPR